MYCPPIHTLRILVSTLLILFVIDSTFSQQRRDRDNGDKLESQEFGKKSSVGVSIFGLGLVGINSRFVTKNESQIEIDLSYAPAFEAFGNPELDDLFDLDNYDQGVTLIGGYNVITGKRDKWWKEKFVKNYVSIKAGYWYTTNKNYYVVGSTWHREAFKYRNKSRSFGLDLGLACLINTNSNTFSSRVTPALFFRMDWNFFKK